MWRVSDFGPDMLAAYRAQWHDPAFVRASCHDYRAAIDIDITHDAQDLVRKVACPALVLYGAEGAMARAMDVPATWAPRLAGMRHQAIPGGHFFPDQSPEATAAALRGFLSGRG